MEDDHFSFGGANGQAHADQAHADHEAELIYTIDQVLQSTRCPGNKYDIVRIHQCRDPPRAPPEPELHANSGSSGTPTQQTILQPEPIKDNAKQYRTKRATLQGHVATPCAAQLVGQLCYQIYLHR